MYIFGGCTLEADFLMDCAALHITSKRWLVFPTKWPAPNSRSVCGTSVFRQQIFLFTGIPNNLFERVREVYVLDTAQIQWLSDKSMGKQALSNLASDSEYTSMGQIEEGN